MSVQLRIQRNLCYDFIVMNSALLRQQLHRQVDRLPEDVLREVYDFTAFLLARRQYDIVVGDWDEALWQEFALEQFFRDDEEDDIEYTLEDAALHSAYMQCDGAEHERAVGDIA